MNVGALSFGGRSQGAAQGATRGALALQPQGALRRLVEWCSMTNEDGSKMYALFGLSSTKVHRLRTNLLRITMRLNGYNTRLSQVEQRTGGRPRAGVMVAWDPKQLRAQTLRPGARGEADRIHRVVTKGRHVIMRFEAATKPATGRGHDFDLAVRYMVNRGLSGPTARTLAVTGPAPLNARTRNV